MRYINPRFIIIIIIDKAVFDLGEVGVDAVNHDT